jgi:hypothetical protein
MALIMNASSLFGLSCLIFTLTCLSVKPVSYGHHLECSPSTVTKKPPQSNIHPPTQYRLHAIQQYAKRPSPPKGNISFVSGTFHYHALRQRLGKQSRLPSSKPYHKRCRLTRPCKKSNWSVQFVHPTAHFL